MTRYRLQNVPTEKERIPLCALFLDQLLKHEEIKRVVTVLVTTLFLLRFKVLEV